MGKSLYRVTHRYTENGSTTALKWETDALATSGRKAIELAEKDLIRRLEKGDRIVDVEGLTMVASYVVEK